MKRDAVRVESWEERLLAIVRNGRRGAADALDDVRVADVPSVAVEYDEILVAVEVHVEECRAPGPLAGVDAREGGDVRPRAVATRELQHVAHPLLLVRLETDRLRHRSIGGDLALPIRERRTHHVGREQIHVTVAIDVAEVHRHACVARLAHRERRNETEIPLAVVEPELIGILEVVADVEIGRAVAVHVVEARGEREVVGILRERRPVRVDEARSGRRRASEVPLSIVEEKEIRLRALRSNDAAEVGSVLDAILLRPFRSDFVLAVHLLHDSVEGDLLRRVRVEVVPHLVRGDVEIEMAIAIDVGEREAGGGVARRQSAHARGVREVSVSVADPQLDRPAECADDEIELAVAVHVGEGGAHRAHERRVDPALRGDVGEPEVAVVMIQRRGALERREKNVRQAVTIHVADRYAGTDQQVSVGQRVCVGDGVGMIESRFPCAELAQTGIALARLLEELPAIASLVVPGAVDGVGRLRACCRREREQ